MRVVNLFLKSGKDICVCEIIDALRLPQYTISKALNILKNAAILTGKKKGLWVYYQLNEDIYTNKGLFNFLKEFLNDRIFSEDEKRLYSRLLLRDNDKCIVGIVPEDYLIKLIKEKIKT